MFILLLILFAGLNLYIFYCFSVIDKQTAQTLSILDEQIANERLKMCILRWYLESKRTQVDKKIILQEMFGRDVNGLLEYCSDFRDSF